MPPVVAASWQVSDACCDPSSERAPAAAQAKVPRSLVVPATFLAAAYAYALHHFGPIVPSLPSVHLLVVPGNDAEDSLQLGTT